jgi:hypothetical protein
VRKEIVPKTRVAVQSQLAVHIFPVVSTSLSELYIVEPTYFVTIPDITLYFSCDACGCCFIYFCT